MKYRGCTYHWLLWGLAAQTLGHMQDVQSSYDLVKRFLWCQTSQMVRTFSLWITFYRDLSSDRDHSEGPGKSMKGNRNSGSQKWKSPRSNHPPFNTHYFNKCGYCCHSVVSGSTSPSLTVTVHTLHWTVGEETCRTLKTTINAFTTANCQQSLYGACIQEVTPA